MAFKKYPLPVVLACLLASVSLRAEEPAPPVPDEAAELSTIELIMAEKEIKEKLGFEPGNADLYFDLSNVYAALFDRTRKKNAESLAWLMKSRNALEKTVMIRPDHAVAHFNLGVVNKRLGKMERAREEFRKAIRVSDPSKDGEFLAACWIQIGEIYAEQKFFDEAEDAFKKALDYDFGNEEVRAAIADIKAAEKADTPGGSPAGASSFMGSMARAGSATDPYAYGSSADAQTGGMAGVAQALPYLGQMLSQKFTGGGGQDDFAQ
ncbi:MAG: Tetratricopeptide repeat protein [Candidatus Omnitrophica bacterium ADurb.Bin292]|jgi:tetratricopeptide (TPR) repeat protein|nr:MAG: Tetratricopeptide repeat protein [Candidatus Omnitrophica bacterium ADurb.Bin292]HQB94220.1 tetratricopeptide repeat protein [Candidatus Omnitrophota bacterium]